MLSSDTDCGAGPQVVQSTGMGADWPASSVLILGETDGYMNDLAKYNYWIMRSRSTDESLILKVDSCKRKIKGIKIKNIGKGTNNAYNTKDFRVSGSLKENGPWTNLLEAQLIDTTGGKPASLITFNFAKTVEFQFLRFELISYWGSSGGGLQYFAAITSGFTMKFIHGTE